MTMADNRARCDAKRWMRRKDWLDDRQTGRQASRQAGVDEADCDARSLTRLMQISVVTRRSEGSGGGGGWWLGWLGWLGIATLQVGAIAI